MVQESLKFMETYLFEFLDKLKKKHANISIDYFQSNIEGELIDKLHEVGFDYDGIVLNAAAYTHTSIGIGDAVKAIETSVIEVHISNVYSREDFRHISYIAPNAKGIIVGLGLKGYELALQAFFIILTPFLYYYDYKDYRLSNLTSLKPYFL